MKKSVVYSCLVGKYDEMAQHQYIDPAWDYVLFTDQDLATIPKPWQCRTLVFTNLDAVRNQRWHKLHPHLLFPEYENSIYLDANIKILKPQLFNDVDLAIKRNDLMAMNQHFKRSNLYDEFDECLKNHKDNLNLIKLQEQEIKKTGFDGYLPNHVFFETNIIYRLHHDPAIKKAMADWWWWLEHYSRRDQLSLSYAIWRNKLPVLALSAKSYRQQDCMSFLQSYGHNTEEDLLYKYQKTSEYLNKITNSKMYKMWRKLSWLKHSIFRK